MAACSRATQPSQTKTKVPDVHTHGSPRFEKSHNRTYGPNGKAHRIEAQDFEKAEASRLQSSESGEAQTLATAQAQPDTCTNAAVVDGGNMRLQLDACCGRYSQGIDLCNFLSS